VAATKAETVMLKLDEQIAGAADRATGALGRLENQIAREQNALGRLNAKAADAADTLAIMKQAHVDPSDFAKMSEIVSVLNDRLGAQKDKLAALGEKAASMGSVSDKATGKSTKEVVKHGDALTDATKKQKEAGDSAVAFADRLGLPASKLKSLGSDLKALGPYGAIAAVGMLILLGAVVAVAGVIAKAISAADELRNGFLRLKAESVNTWGGMSWLYNGMVASNAAAATMEAAINRVAVGTARTREELMGYASQIRQARFTGKDFETVLKTMAIAGAGNMKERPGQFLAMAQAARMTGRSIDDLAERVKKGLGVVADEELISLGVQIKKLGENLTWVFGGADIEPILKVVHSFLSLLNMGSPTATGLRDTITLLVETAINKFLKLTIVLLKTYIWIKQHTAAWETIKVVVAGVAILFGVLAGAMLLVLTVSSALLAVAALPFIIFGVALHELFTGFSGIKAILAAIDFPSLGSSIIHGIVNGIMSAGSAIWNALKGIIGGAIDSVKDFLGISSPSKLFRDEVGQQMAAGTAQGVEQGGGDVAEASTKMAGGGVSGAKAVANDNAAPSAGRSVVFTGCNFYGTQTEADIRKMVFAAFETESLDAAVPA
jgi:hypothetical protein